MERLGITTNAAVEAETLTERLDSEIAAHDGTVMGPPMHGDVGEVAGGLAGELLTGRRGDDRQPRQS